MSSGEARVIPSGEAIELGNARSMASAEPRLFSSQALEALYREHGARLRGLLARRVGVEDASDAVHEAFAKLARMLPTGRASIHRPEAFVTTVATNVLRDRARTAARQALHLSQLASHDCAGEDDPHRLLESREALRAIEQALSGMSARRRRIFLLHRFEHLTYAEIGLEVGMSEKGVKKQMAKALLELRCAVERQA